MEADKQDKGLNLANKIQKEGVSLLDKNLKSIDEFKEEFKFKLDQMNEEMD